MNSIVLYWGIPGAGDMVTGRSASRILAEALRLQHLAGPEALGSPDVERHSRSGACRSPRLTSRIAPGVRAPFPIYRKNRSTTASGTTAWRVRGDIRR